MFSWKPSSFIALAAGLLLAAPAACAQSDDFWMNRFNDANQAAVNSSLVTLNNSAVMAAANKAAAKRGTTAAAGKATRTSFTYVPTATLQRQTADAYVAQVKATSPTAAATVATALAGKTNYPALYRELNNGTGLRENDAADVMAIYLIESWIIASGVTDASVITAAKTQGVRAQAAGVLARNPNLRSAAALAQFGEQLKLNAALLEVGRLRAQHDGTSANFSQKVAAQFRNQYHFDLSQLQLTTQGLVKK